MSCPAPGDLKGSAGSEGRTPDPSLQTWTIHVAGLFPRLQFQCIQRAYDRISLGQSLSRVAT